MKKKITRKFVFETADVVEALLAMMENRDWPVPRDQGLAAWSHQVDGTYVVEWTEET